MTLLGKIGWINNSKYVVYICVVVYYTKFELFTSTSSGDEICWRCSIGDTRATSDDNFAIFPRPCTVIYVKRFQRSCVNNKPCQKKAQKFLLFSLFLFSLAYIYLLAVPPLISKRHFQSKVEERRRGPGNRPIEMFDNLECRSFVRIKPHSSDR